MQGYYNHYGCGQELMIVSGATTGTQVLFTEVGQLPSYYNPQTAWVNSEIIYLDNAAWLFTSAPSDVSGPGADPAGIYTPCSRCSIAKVDTIAQNGVSTYAIDGSYFGVNAADQNTILWNQVAFGEWGSDCYNGTSLCTFYAPGNPTVYYGGPQYYPNSYIAQANLAPTGYGPYESYDGLSVNGTRGDSIARMPQGALTEPLPPTAPLSVNLGASAFVSGGCGDQVVNANVGPIAAWRMGSEGTLDSSTGNIVLGSLFQNAFAGYGLVSPGVFTDQASWSNLLHEAASVAATTAVTIYTTVTISAACGGA
ncbi:hypothetical protein EPN44_03915 [bacterium]|nr:MAG: hypothetical protein EPN44_03915 [bacterium]